jgi:hypothetical protein
MGLQAAFAVKYGSTVVSGLTSLTANPGANVRADIGIGSLFPQFAAIDSVLPRFQFQSRAIKAVLNITGSTYAVISEANPLIAYWVALVNGVPQTTGTLYTANKGFLIPRQLQATHRGDATIDCEAILASSDGAAAPFAISTGAMPTIVRDSIRHTLKSASMGVSLGCITNLSLQFGVNAETLGCKSDVFDRHLSIKNGVTPSMSFTTLESDLLVQSGSSGIAIGGTALTHNNASVTLRQYAEDGIGFAASSEDLTITAHGIATWDSTSGTGPAEATGGVNVTCSWDGTNSPIVIS